MYPSVARIAKTILDDADNWMFLSLNSVRKRLFDCPASSPTIIDQQQRIFDSRPIRLRTVICRHQLFDKFTHGENTRCLLG